MAFFLIIPFVLIALIEVAIFIQVGEWIGVGPTLLAVIATAILGGYLLRRQGLGTLSRAQASLARHELPVRELFDGVCILIGGALLLTPGFLTDITGLTLLIPPIRAVLRTYLWKRLTSRGGAQVWVNGEPVRPRPEPRRPTDGAGPVIEGEFSEVDPKNPWRPTDMTDKDPPPR